MAAIQPITSIPLPQDHLIGESVEKTVTLVDQHDLQVCILAEGTLQVTDGERLIRVSGLDQLGKQTVELLRQDQKRSIQLDKELTRISQIGTIQTSIGVFSTAIGVAAGVATGGVAGLVIAAGALLSGAHQIVSRADGYHTLASQFTSDTQEQEKLGQAFHTYVGYLCFANTLMNFAIGGTELAKKGFEEATRMSMQGASDVTALAQGLTNMVQTNLQAKHTVLQIEGQKITLELTEIGFIREEHNAAFRESAKAEELAIQGVITEQRIKGETTQKIIRGR